MLSKSKGTSAMLMLSLRSNLFLGNTKLETKWKRINSRVSDQSFQFSSSSTNSHRNSFQMFKIQINSVFQICLITQ